VNFGIRLRKLWRHRLGVSFGFVLALLVAVWSNYSVTLSPFGLQARNLEMATAVTHVMVDTPVSTMVDLRQDTYAVQGLTDKAVLLGNVIASSSVQERIARRAGVTPELLRIQAPLTTAQPWPPVDSESARRTSDILKVAEEYRVDVKVNATVPMIDVYAQTPTAETATAIANAVVAELQTYVTAVAARQRTPDKNQIRLVQLGSANGSVINHGVKYQVAGLVFVLVFLGWCATVTFFARVRSGWREAVGAERPAEA
jgi:hypothetical protein